MKKPGWFVITSTCLVLLSCSRPDDNGTASINYSDAKLLNTIYTNALYAIRSAEEAITRSTDFETKQVAQQVIADNSAIRSVLEEVAGRRSYQLPLDIDDVQLNNWLTLVRKKGLDFDMFYLNETQQVETVQLATITKASREAVDIEVRDIAHQLLSQLKYKDEVVSALAKKVSLRTALRDLNGTLAVAK